MTFKICGHRGIKIHTFLPLDKQPKEYLDEIFFLSEYENPKIAATL